MSEGVTIELQNRIVLRAVSLVYLFVSRNILAHPLLLSLICPFRRRRCCLLLRTCLGWVCSRPTLVGDSSRRCVSSSIVVTRVVLVSPFIVELLVLGTCLLLVFIDALERVGFLLNVSG